MENNTTRFDYLLRRFREGQATIDELNELLKQLDDQAAADGLRKIWEQMPQDPVHFDEVTSQKILSSITGNQQVIPITTAKKKRYLIPAIAASVVLIIAAAWLLQSVFSTKSNMSTASVETKPLAVQIVPGDNRAVLRLSDGRSILLDSAGNGKLVNEGNTSISKKDGLVIYTGAAGDPSGQNNFNTLTTPKGGQYQLVLSDGTRVWMNAASSLRYPSSFNGKDREVELTGEAYFEVTKDAARPFHVRVKEMDVQVLGTHFNVNAYDNENSVNTTLLEGAVKVNGNMNGVLLKPGQQAVGQPGKALTVVNDVDVEGVVAWKNGYFQFDQAGLDVLMRQIERWYDVTVRFEGNVPNRQFGGKISRNSNINDVLKILELTKVGFRIEGKTIIVTDKL